MSERFNFYDVYGYLIPGFALLGFLWLPVGIASHAAPNLKLADALGWLFIAYVLGHVLSGITILAFPSGRSVSRGVFSHPSDDLVDDTLYPSRTRLNADLRWKIKDAFALDLTQTLPEPELRELRERAFLLCRDRLILQGKGAYVEQFQGMYSMMRGISSASIIAAYYLLGWLLAGISAPPQEARGSAGDLPIAVALVGVAVAWLDFRLSRPRKAAKASQGTARPASQAETPAPVQGSEGNRRRRLPSWVWPATVFWVLVAGACYAGYLLGLSCPSLAGRPSLLVALAAGAIFLAGRCYNGFQHFAWTFADTVYRNFLALPKST